MQLRLPGRYVGIFPVQGDLPGQCHHFRVLTSPLLSAKPSARLVLAHDT